MGEAEEIAKAVQEASKAVQETAKLGSRGLESSEKAAGFVARILQEPLEQAAGLLTDQIRFWRIKRLEKMSESVDQILKAKGVQKTRPVPPKIALPVIDAAALEDDDDLQMLWSHLIANAMNPSFNEPIRYGFINMIKELTGHEVKVLYELYMSLRQQSKTRPLNELAEHEFKPDEIRKIVPLSEEELAVARNNLVRMQLCAAWQVARSMKSGHPVTSQYSHRDSIGSVEKIQCA